MATDRTRHKLGVVLVTVAFAAGCGTPWPARDEFPSIGALTANAGTKIKRHRGKSTTPPAEEPVEESAVAAAPPQAEPVAVSQVQHTDPPPVVVTTPIAPPSAPPTAPSTNPPHTQEQAFLAILEDLSEIAATDPAAHQQLIYDLKQAPPEQWPLITQQFRAALAYRQQLAERSGGTSPNAPRFADRSGTVRLPGPPPVSREQEARSGEQGVGSSEQEVTETARQGDPETRRLGDSSVSPPYPATGASLPSPPPVLPPTAPPEPVAKSPTQVSGSVALPSERAAASTRDPFNESSPPPAMRDISPVEVDRYALSANPPAPATPPAASAAAPVAPPQADRRPEVWLAPFDKPLDSSTAEFERSPAPPNPAAADNQYQTGDRYSTTATPSPPLVDSYASPPKQTEPTENKQQGAGSGEQGMIPSGSQSSNPADWQGHVELAIQQLRSDSPEYPRNNVELQNQAKLRLLEIVAGRREKALEPTAGAPLADQEVWQGMLSSLSTYLDVEGEPDQMRRAGAAAAELEAASQTLNRLGPLTICRLAFCREVYGFGAFDAYEANQFQPGEQVSLYAEFDHFESQKNDDGFLTSLASSYQIVDAGGNRVEGGEFPDVDDTCQSRRKDFYIQYGLTLPDDIKPGRYQLELVARDRLANKISRRTLAFEVIE